MCVVRIGYSFSQCGREYLDCSSTLESQYRLAFAGLTLAPASFNHFRTFKHPLVILPSLALLGSIVVIVGLELNFSVFSGASEGKPDTQQIYWIATQVVSSTAVLRQ